jgi:hypothetical protein
VRNSRFAPGLDHFWGVVRRSGLFSEISDRFISLEVFVANEVLSIWDVYVGKEHTFCVDLQGVGEEEPLVRVH